MIPSPARRNVLFALAITATLLNLVDRQIISVLKPVIAADLHWTDNDYGTLAAWFQGAAALAFLVTGTAVDRLGVKWANPVGVALWSLAALAHGGARSFTSFIICRVSLGAAEAMGTPAAIKTIAVIFPPAMRSIGYGITNTVGSLGAIIAPLVIPAVAALWGWRSAFVIGGALGLIWAIVWLVAARGVSFGDKGATATASASSGQGGILRERRSWAIAIAKFLSDATWWLMLFWMPDFFHRSFGLEGVALGAPLAIAYGGSAIGSLIAGGVASRLIHQGKSIERVRKGSLLVAALCATPLPFADYAHNYVIAVSLMALVMGAHQAFSVNLFALIADVSPPEKVGRVTSFGAFSGNIGGMVIAKVAGMTLGAGFGYLPLFLFAGCSYLLALGAIQLLLPRLPLEGVAAAPRAMGH